MSENLLQKIIDNRGFGKHKKYTVDLLNDLIKILDDNNIDYFLISGTLLGQQRHNDFIPWDDDVDIIVSIDFIKKYNEINFGDCRIFEHIKGCLFKFSHKEKIVSHKKNQYCWPFIDMFIFDVCMSENGNKSLLFFSKHWDYDKFYPIQKQMFNNILVSIPNDPHYFLKINFGDDYMTVYKFGNWNHRLERQYKNNFLPMIATENFL